MCSSAGFYDSLCPVIHHMLCILLRFVFDSDFCLCVSGLRTEGIFRRSARVQLIKDVQKLYNLGEQVISGTGSGDQ